MECVQVGKFKWGDPRMFHSIEWDKPLYKYVDLKHAQGVAAGSTKIGTIWGFRRMEGSKNDSRENIIPFDFRKKKILSGKNPHDKALLASIGLYIPEEVDIVLKGATFNYVGQDYYACCFSEAIESTSLIADGPQAVFRIDDIRSWVSRICQICDVLGPAKVRKVAYRDRRTFRMSGGHALTDPFVKPMHYADEQEVRVLWMTNGDTEMGAFPEMEIIRADPVIASLLTRVA